MSADRIMHLTYVQLYVASIVYHGRFVKFGDSCIWTCLIDHVFSLRMFLFMRIYEPLNQFHIPGMTR